MRIRRAVIGIDFGAPSIAAAKWALHHFLPDADVELVLVHVVPIPEPAPATDGAQSAATVLADTARAGARERLRAVADTLGASRVRVEVRVGDPAAELAAAARRDEADLLLVGKRSVRHGDWARLGDTATSLASLTPVPLLLVTGARDVRPRRLLVALDAKADSSLLRWTKLLAEEFGARVTAVHVERAPARRIKRSLAAIGAHRAPAPTAPDVGDAWHEESRWLGELATAGIDRAKAQVELRSGDAAREILATAERLGSELILVGHHGDARVRHALLGSVARGVLRGARCPVLLVIEPTDEIVEGEPTAPTPTRGTRP